MANLQIVSQQAINSTFDELEAHRNRYLELQNELSTIVDRLEDELSKHRHLVISQYTNTLTEKMAQLDKWQGDLEWLRLGKARSSQVKIDRQHELQSQLLEVP